MEPGADRVIEVVRRHWGFDALRPLQREAIDAALAARDAMVVLPTGGGKSLCYQVPPLVTGGLTVVASPLIALMQDQVDGLKLAGVTAAALHSHTSADEARCIRELAAAHELRLLLVAPERLLTPPFIAWLRGMHEQIRSIAVDEAHCISQWGHDFRPEYRRLAELRQALPGVSMQAFTATATPRVQDDIVAQLRLRDPARLVGVFDRPNLTYRVVPRERRLADQVASAVKPHAGQASIVYCISRKDTEALAEALKRLGVDARAYHAGMPGAERARVQNAFRKEKLDVVVATVAFGMGIDRSDVRCVVHAAMPQSVEHYQQETGRAGRDGLPAECILLHSGSDLLRWRKIYALPDENGDPPDPGVVSIKHGLLEQMNRVAAGRMCRHRALSAYFGQEYSADSCSACDVCLNERAPMEGGTLVARKILSCIARVKEAFGAAHVADVLMGKSTERVIQYRHTELSTFGLLREMNKTALTACINQLIDAGLLERSGDEYPVLKLNAASWEVMRGTREADLYSVGSAAASRGKSSHSAELPAEAAELFERLRAMRRSAAEELSVPPFVVFSDATLREIALARPGSLETLRWARGIGQRKLEDFGALVLACVSAFCAEKGLAMDILDLRHGAAIPPASPRERRGPLPAPAAEMFAKGDSIDDVARALSRARGTVVEYLANWISETNPPSIAPWVPDEDRLRIEGVVRELGPQRFKVIFERLGGALSYDTIRLVVAHLAVSGAMPG